MWPEMPTGVDDRDADVWEALLSVADLAGKHWPETARVSAVSVVTALSQPVPASVYCCYATSGQCFLTCRFPALCPLR